MRQKQGLFWPKALLMLLIEQDAASSPPVFSWARYTCLAPQAVSTPSAGPLPHRAY